MSYPNFVCGGQKQVKLSKHFQLNTLSYHTKNKQINPKFLQKVLVQSFCIEYMNIDMYVIKHHNKFQSDMPSHIREMAKESYLNIYC